MGTKRTSREVAKAEKRKAQRDIDRIEADKTPNKQQLKKLAAAKKTRRNAQKTIAASGAASKVKGATPTKRLENLRDEYSGAKKARADAQLALQRAEGRGLKGRQLTAYRQAVFDAGIQSRAYGDAMRGITGRQKGGGTPYVGPGVQVYLDDGKPALTDKGVVKYDVDTEAYLKRFIPSFRPTAEQLARTGGPGGWAGGLLSGDDDYTYLTPWQQTNLQTLLGSGEDIAPQDAALEIMGLPKSLRTDWRQETWGDEFDPDTGLWRRADPTRRAAAVEDQLRRYEAGLFNPYTGQPEESTGPAPWANVRRIWDILGDDTTTTNLNNTLNRTQGTSAFVHPYAADPYTVPHMQTGGLWEGLGAEYQPGTVEGLGLIAGDAYAPYEPLARGLLDARPSFMGTPKGFTPMNFKGGLEGSTDDTTTNNKTTTGPVFGYKWDASADGGKGANVWTKL